MTATSTLRHCRSAFTESVRWAWKESHTNRDRSFVELLGRHVRIHSFTPTIKQIKEMDGNSKKNIARVNSMTRNLFPYAQTVCSCQSMKTKQCTILSNYEFTKAYQVHPSIHPFLWNDTCTESGITRSLGVCTPLKVTAKVIGVSSML